MILPLALAVVPWVSQAVAEDPRVVAAMAALPAELAAMQRDAAPRADKLVVYHGSMPGLGIVVMVSSYGANTAKLFDDNGQRDEALRGIGIVTMGAASQSQRQESWFITDTKTGARGFFDECADGNKRRLVWATEHDGVLTVVKALIPNAADRQRVFDSVMRELFGGATLIQTN